MSKKIKTTDTDLTVSNSNAIIVTVGLFKFSKEEFNPQINIYEIGHENDEFIECVYEEKEDSILDFKDLEIFALNWIFNNVEIVKDIEKETAPEVPVQEQPNRKFVPEDSNGVCADTPSIECPSDDIGKLFLGQSTYP